MAEEWITKQIDKYIIVNQKLGSGAFGTVYRGFKKNDETKQVAVKAISIASIKDSAKMVEHIKREISILQQANNPHIVKLYDVARTPHYLYLFLEYCHDGDLKKYLSTKYGRRLSEVEAVIFLKHLVEGFRTLHQLKIIHRDIKPANILLHKGVAKITDFGFARVIDTGMNDPAYFSRVGSPLYMAPQILEGQPFSSKCDVWSMGVMLFEMLYGKPPWDGDNQYNLLQNIKKTVLMIPDAPVRSDKIKQLLRHMLVVQEKDRYSWEQIFNHEIIQIQEAQIKNNLEQLMKEKDELSRSESLNKLYLEMNLVVGYLDQPEQILQEPSTPQLTQGNEEKQSVDDINHEKGLKIINQYETEQKRRKAMLKYNTYFLFERNIAFFFNYVIQKIIKMSHQGMLKLTQELYYSIIFCISKNQNVHLKRMYDQLMSTNPDKFDRETWGRYLISQEYKKILTVTKNDIKHTEDFYLEIYKKEKQIIDKELTQPDNKRATKIKQVLDVNFDQNNFFQQLYQSVVQEGLDVIKTSIKQTKDSDPVYKDLLQLGWFLVICLNPYLEFKDINMDFNQFYEEMQTLTETQFLEKIGKRLDL
ncbi:unnamed protein product [Paramecium primaurelia]|uniref:Protein kinase domain-containing protein n=1 Tax=Paramecium primaurelia TaxID=5886 RepID=A0A8S1NLV6_PARPR|nr:unnamed protein product [Paramecium primaurelia]